MRISGGKARGIPLRVNKKSGSGQRSKPVGNGSFRLSQKVENAQVLDLFAGSGAYGLEALSRGADQATLVEKTGWLFQTSRRTSLPFKKVPNYPWIPVELPKEMY